MCICLSSAEAAGRTEKIQKVLSMCKIARFLANYVIQKGTVKEDEREMYEYGFQIAIESVLCLITCFVISLMLHTIPEGILFFVIFVPLRSYAGGLHLNNYWSCFSLSCLTFFAIMIIGKYLTISMYIALVLLLFLEVAVYNMYPVENSNRVVDADENRHFKKRLQQFLLIDIIIAILCTVFGWHAYLQTIVLTFLMVALTMAIGKIKNRGLGHLK